MIDITKTLAKAKELLGVYNSRVLRTTYASKELTGESASIIKAVIEAVNNELKEIEKRNKEAIVTLNNTEVNSESFDESKLQLDDPNEPKADE